MNLSEKIVSLLSSGLTPEEVAKELNLELRDDAVMLPGWFADDGNAEVYFPEAKTGKEAAEEYVSDGSWGESDESVAIRVSTWRIGFIVDNNIVENTSFDEDSHLIVLHPEEPECKASEDNEHWWISPYELVGGIKENPGVWGTGGCGIRSVEVCGYCGMAKIYQTASQGYDTEYDHNSIYYSNNEADGAVTVEDLAEYYDDDMPEGLCPNSDLAYRMKERYLLSIKTINKLEEWATKVETYGDSLLLHDLNENDVDEVMKYLGDGYELDWYYKYENYITSFPKEGSKQVALISVK